MEGVCLCALGKGAVDGVQATKVGVGQGGCYWWVAEDYLHGSTKVGKQEY